MQDRFLKRYFDKVTQVIYTLKPIMNTCENGKDIVYYGILVSGIGQISEYDLDNTYSSRFIKMQCTGREDKNSKLIFEADVIFKKGSKNYKGEKMFSKVLWSKDSAAFMISDENGLHQMPHNSNNMEVIGNIYENPELLKKE